MELRVNMQRAASRPMAWLAAMLIVLAVGLLSLQTIADVRATRHTSTVRSPSPTAAPLLDRNAERQPGQTPRAGGPDGQVGDAPQAP